MKQLKKLLAITLSAVLVLSGCQSQSKNNTNDTIIQVVATTTMLADLAREIGKEHVSVEQLMQPGVDPHLYQASAGDVLKMQNADVVLYNGLHLEGKMEDVFDSLAENDRFTINASNGIDKSLLLTPIVEDENLGVYDPHIWFDASLWNDCAREVATQLGIFDPQNKSDYEANYQQYATELEDLETYIHEKIEELPVEQRVLVTAHDAFQYFSRRYNIEVKSLQGISTDSEAGTADVSETADFIVQREIKAIFIESSVPPRTIEALQAAVKAKGFDTVIGGELYSDSLGGENSGADTYITMVKANVDLIVDSLK